MKVQKFLVVGFVCSLVSSSALGANPPVLVFVDSSPSMDKPMESGKTRFAVLKTVVNEQIKSMPLDQPLGLAAFGVSRGCDDSNIPTLLPMGAGAPNRTKLTSELNKLKSGSGSPFVLAMQRGVQNLTGVLVPVHNAASEFADHPYYPNPDAKLPNEKPDPNTPTMVIVSDAEDTCGHDPCQFMADLQKSGAKVRIHLIAIGDPNTERTKQALKCMNQFWNFDSTIVKTGTDLKFAIQKASTGEALKATALSLPPSNKPDPYAPKLQVKQEAFGHILTKEEIYERDSLKAGPMGVLDPPLDTNSDREKH